MGQVDRDAEQDADDETGDEPDDDDEPDVPADGVQQSERQLVAAPGLGGGPLALQVERQTVEAKLMRGYLAASFVRYSYISFEVENESGGGAELSVFQVLELERNTQNVHTYLDACAGDQLYANTVQPLCVFGRGGLVNGVVRPEIDVYIFEDPLKLDILSLIGCERQRRSKIMSWTYGQSDVDGCFRRHTPNIVTPTMVLSDKATPILCLLDALQEKGFEPSERIVHHDKDSPKCFGGRKPTDKRSYLQCVLALR